MGVIEESVSDLIRRRYSQTKHHLALSLTNNCPLKCAHCITSALHGGRDRSPTAERLAHWMVSGMAAARDRLSMITFTGGESPLADVAFSMVGEEAARQGIKCALITSGFWSKDITAGVSFLQKHPFILYLTVSIDRHHLEWLPLEVPISAIESAKKVGIPCSIRFTGNISNNDDINLYNHIKSTSDVSVEFQSIVSAGRASDTGADVEEDYIDTATSQCFSTGPHIESDGSINPCCSNLINAGRQNPLSNGYIWDKSLNDVLDYFEKDDLLRVLKVWGWDYVRECIGVSEVAGQNLQLMGGCRQCGKIMADRDAAQKVSLFKADPTVNQAAKEAEVFARR